MPSKLSKQLKKIGKQVETVARTARDQVAAEAKRAAESPTGQRIEREAERVGDQIERETKRIAEQVSDSVEVVRANAALHHTRHQATEILKEIQSDYKIVDERLKEAQNLLDLIEKQSSEDDLLMLERGAVQAATMLQRQSKNLEKKAEDERSHISSIPKLVDYDIDKTTLQGAQALSTIQGCSSKIKANLEQLSKIKEQLTAKYNQLTQEKSGMREEDSAEFGSRLTALEMSFAGCSSSSTSTMSGSSMSVVQVPSLLTSLTQQQQTQPRLNIPTGDTTSTPSDREKLTVT